MRVAQLVILGLVSIALCAPVSAQVSRHISRVNTPSAEQGVSAAVSVELAPTSTVKRAYLRYRGFGVTEYTELEMLAAGRSETATIPGDAIQPPYIQYYFVLELEDGTRETFPEAAAELNPLQLAVQQVDPREKEIRFLSPEPGETVAQEEFVLAISLYYTTDVVARTRTKIYVDGVDVSREAILSDDVILWSPKASTAVNKLGSHTVRVELRDTTGSLYYTQERSFNLSTSEAIQEEAARLQYGGDVRAEYRNEQTANAQTYARVETRVNGEYSFLTFGTNLRFDNLEEPARQPQNRHSFFADAEYVRLEAGDAYPRFPSLMMIGKRVRGITGAVKLGFFNIDVSVGQTDRKIEGIFLQDTTFADTNAVRNRPSNSIQKSAANYFKYALFTPGTFQRDFYGIRPSFGSGENFQWGLTFLKFKDNDGSIKYGVTPKENLVVGTDLQLGFDDQRIRWETQVAVGLQNKDITGGSFSEADYDSLKAQGTDVKALGQLAEDFITVNGSLEPLNPAGTGLPGIAMESFVTLNYFNNYIRAQYVRRGTSYKSYGNEFLQSDIQGISMSDNIRLFSNKLFASVSYEAKSDNLSNTKRGTTNYGNMSGALTYSPGARYPTLQVGYGLNSRLNDERIFSPDSSRSSKSADDKANRITFGASYDANFGFRNYITLSVSMVDRKDNTIYKRNQLSTFLTGSVSSFFTALPMQTTLSILTNSTASDNQVFKASGSDSIIAKNEYAYTAVAVGGQYRLLEDRWRINVQVTPTFGDLERTVLRVGTDYSYKAHVFELEWNYYKNSSSSGLKNDAIMSFIYRYNF